jgi:hypothetical protein
MDLESDRTEVELSLQLLFDGIVHVRVDVGDELDPEDGRRLLAQLDAADLCHGNRAPIREGGRTHSRTAGC